jgi:RNA polymerase sigma factor (sigma-70 family)
MKSSDAELLDDYVRRRSDAAFAELVRRYVNLVHGSATRQLIDHHLADDVTQAVFIVLARKAGKIRGDYLAGWLLNTTRFCVADARKKIGRRNFHEGQAAAMKMAITENSDSSREEIFQHLDEAIGCLPARQSTAISMRFLQNKSSAEVAAVMGISQDAAQKIITRALPKLRRILVGRGLVLSGTGGLVESMLVASQHAAPANLALLSHARSVGGLSIAKGALRIMFWNKAVGAIAVATIVVSSGTGLMLLHNERNALALATPAVSTPLATPVAIVETKFKPFPSPFLEMDGCFIKHSAHLSLNDAPGNPLPQLSVFEHQKLMIQWVVTSDIRAKADRYEGTILNSDDSGNDGQSFKYKISDGSKSSLQLTSMVPVPAAGDYIVRVQAMASNKIIAQSSLPLTVKPFIKMDIEIFDLRSDGSLQFFGALQQLNNSNNPIKEDSFSNSGGVRYAEMTDQQGQPIAYSRKADPEGVRFTYTLNEPVAPGKLEIVSASGELIAPIARKLPDGNWQYSADNGGSDQPMRRLDLIRLPVGAELISVKSPGMQHRIVDGRVQIFLDTTLPVGGNETVAFRYRLPAVAPLDH